jgi:hypothetical protein
MKSSLLHKLSSLVQRPRKVERRIGSRITPNSNTLALLRTGESQETTTGYVVDLSAQDAAFLAERDYPPGTILKVLLINSLHTFSLAVDVKVARSTRGSGRMYLIAGPFSQPLQHEQIVPLIV